MGPTADFAPSASPLTSARRAFAEALAGPAGARLTEVGLRVEVLAGADRFVLDFPGRAVSERGEQADATLALPAEQLAALAAGRLPLQLAILAGDVTFEGPVARLLDAWPVLSSALQRDGAVAADSVTGPYTAVRESQAGDFWTLRCVDVHKRFGVHEVLRGVTFGIPPGMITAVIGPSGTGKSVLIKHLTGLLMPDAGDVEVQGRWLTQMSVAELLALRRRIGMLFQDGALWSSMTIYDNVALPLRHHTDLCEREIREVVEGHLEQVGLAAAARRMPGQLSGGMRKRAGFARALVLDPEIIICDEPDSGLDPVRTALLSELLAQVHAELGGTYVIVTHDIRLVRRVAQYIVVLWKGEVVEAGPAASVLASQDPFVRQFLAGEGRGPLGMG